MADISTLFNSVSLPVMPQVGAALISTLDDDDVPSSKILALIARDPALSAKLLALANSASFGLPRQVATLDNALSLVGLARLRALALSACLRNAFAIPAGIDGAEFWRYSIACAGYAQWLADGLPQDMKVERQKAWLTGLMLRLGELLIAHAAPQSVKAIVAQPCLPGERWAREKQEVGFDEGEVSGELARRWNFPTEMGQAMLAASEPTAKKPLLPLAGVLHLAGRLAELPHAQVEAIDTLPIGVLSALSLNYDWMKKTFPDASTFVNINALAKG